ncbi:MAG: VacJ protein [Azospirillum sp.]|nr:VacJ protein [Azospirillum sp.]
MRDFRRSISGSIARSLAVGAVVAATLAAGPARSDPLEPVNRAMFTFNDYAVYYVIDPLSDFTQTWIPIPVREIGKNLYENLTEPEFVVAHLLAGDHQSATNSFSRFVVNSTVGLAGAFDVASALGIERRHIEFGEALCAAGAPAGDYLVLPLVGPTNVTTASLVTGFIVGGWYLLSMISPILATADLVIDFSASAASLRYANDMPGHEPTDPYALQREGYLEYLAEACPAAETPTPAQPAAAHAP